MKKSELKQIIKEEIQRLYKNKILKEDSDKQIIDNYHVLTAASISGVELSRNFNTNTQRFIEVVRNNKLESKLHSLATIVAKLEKELAQLRDRPDELSRNFFREIEELYRN